MTELREYFNDSSLAGKRTNAVLSGILALYLLINCLNILLDGGITWSAYAFSVVLLVFIPPIYFKDWSAFVPFEVLLFLTIPFTLKGIEAGFIASHTLNYLSAAGIALLLVTELDTFTSFKSTPSFAVLLVSFTTIATSAIWAVVRWISNIYLGTAFIISEKALMWEFSASLAAGILAGLGFWFYLRRRDKEVRKSEIQR